jgi:urease accessory protein
MADPSFCNQGRGVEPEPQGAAPAAAPAPAGWVARLGLRFEVASGRTVLAAKSQHGPLTVQRPFYPEGGVCHLYLLHPPGGVVGGDRLSLTMDVGCGAHALITTPGAAKFYRTAGPEAVQEQRLQVAEGGLLEWFPHENILFPGASLHSGTEVHLARGARFLGWEIHSLGRPVIGERFENGKADLQLSLLRGGRPLLLERLRLGSAGDLDGPSILRGFPVSATLIATGAGAADLAAARDLGDDPPRLLLGITLLEDVLVARCLAQGVEAVRRIFLRLWGILRPRLVGCAICPPRIWAT